MTHEYQISGMTCDSCTAKVKSALLQIEAVNSVDISLEQQNAQISMDKHISIQQLQEALGGKESKYQINVKTHSETVEKSKSWFKTYKPILLIFSYITIFTLLTQYLKGIFDFQEWMRYFMASFFIVFSFFKLLDLNAFAESYVSYDILAKKIRAWGFVYAFIELALGTAYFVNFYPLVTNVITFIVMTLSIIGVLQAVFNKRQIRCACLGAVFNLPMSTITIIEDALMIIMSGFMIFYHL